MKRLGTLAAAALLAGAMTTSGAGAAPAVSGATQGIAKAESPQIQLVRSGWGGGRGWHGHWRGHRGGWGWGGVGAGLAAGLLLTSPYWAGYGYGPYYDDYYGGAYAYDDGFARCEATFRSFDPRTGTYMGYDGFRHRCPYL